MSALSALTVFPKGGSDPEGCQVSQQPAKFKVIQPWAPLAAWVLVQPAMEEEGSGTGFKKLRCLFQKHTTALTHLPPGSSRLWAMTSMCLTDPELRIQPDLKPHFLLSLSQSTSSSRTEAPSPNQTAICHHQGTTAEPRTSLKLQPFSLPLAQHPSFPLYLNVYMWLMPQGRTSPWGRKGAVTLRPCPSRTTSCGDGWRPPRSRR